MFQPVKTALGRWFHGFYSNLSPTTKAMHEFVGRGFAQSIVVAPGRMIDSVEEMEMLWLRNDHNPSGASPTSPRPMPVIIFALGNELTPTGRDYSRQVASPEWFMFDDDAKERIFKLRTVAGDVRLQVVIMAMDEPTARSLAQQFALWLDVSPNVRFHANYRFAGVDRPWPVQFETAEVMFQAARTEAKNLVVLYADLMMHCTVPMYQAPAEGEPNDGNGTDGDPNDPHGYPKTLEVISTFMDVRP